jgi:hypothetical protein
VLWSYPARRRTKSTKATVHEPRAYESFPQPQDYDLVLDLFHFREHFISELVNWCRLA